MNNPLLKSILTAIAAGVVQALLQHFAGPQAGVAGAGATALGALLMQSPIQQK
jgi:hypothetical protein